MILVHRDFETGEVDQEVELDWNGPSGCTIVLRVREFEKNFAEDETYKTEASAALMPDDCRALAANLLQMADRFEKER